jgi:hypothetical protein
MKGLPREVPNLFLAEEKKLRKKLKKTNSKKTLNVSCVRKGFLARLIILCFSLIILFFRQRAALHLLTRLIKFLFFVSLLYVFFRQRAALHLLSRIIPHTKILAAMKLLNASGTAVTSTGSGFFL